MLKTILVPTRGTDDDDATLAAALSVARMFAAHLDVLHVRQDVAQAAVSLGDATALAIYPDLLQQLEQQEVEREASTKRRVEQFCVREGIAMSAPAQARTQSVSARWHCEVGDRASWVARYGQTSELLVIGRSGEREAGAVDLFEAALFDTGRPLYIVGVAPKPADTVVIAWKPTRESARAVAAAAPFLAKAKRVVVLTVEEGAPTSVDSAARLVAALQRHDLAVERHHLTTDGQSAPGRLLSQAAGLAAGLLVMGGYGHSRMREWIFGGFTQHVLTASPLPVLMCH